MKNLAGARIRLNHAHRPTASAAIGPLDGGITLVEGVGSVGQIFDDERIAESRLLKCLVPPQRTATSGRAHRFRNGSIEIESDGLNRIADRGGRILFFKPPAVN